VVSPAEGEAADLGDGDVDVAGAGEEAGGAEEAVTLLSQIQIAGDRDRVTAVLLVRALTREFALPPVEAVAAPSAAAAAVAGFGVEVAVGVVAVGRLAAPGVPVPPPVPGVVVAVVAVGVGTAALWVTGTLVAGAAARTAGPSFSTGRASGTGLDRRCRGGGDGGGR
jgi:hypothetical protein